MDNLKSSLNLKNSSNLENLAPIKLVVWFTLFLDAAACSISLPVVPKLIERLVHSDTSLAASYYGLLLAMSGVLLFYCGPLQAVLSDHFGRRKMLITATAGSALGLIALALSPNLICLFLAQFIFAATGASQPVAACYIAETREPGSRTKNFSTLTGIVTLGFIVGASSGGLLGQFGLTLALTVATLASLLTVALIATFFEEKTQPEKPEFSEKPQIEQKKHKARLSRLSMDLLRANPITSSKFLFSKAALGGLALVMLCGDFAFQTFLSTWVLFTTLRFHWSVSQSGASIGLQGLFAVVVQVVFLRYALPRFGLTKTLFAALFFDALSLVLYNCIDGSLIVVGVIALHCAGAAVKPACTAALSAAVSAAEQAKLQGAIASQSALASVAASILGTALFGLFTSASAPIYFPGVSLLLGFGALVVAMIVLLAPHAGLLARKTADVASMPVMQEAKLR